MVTSDMRECRVLASQTRRKMVKKPTARAPTRASTRASTRKSVRFQLDEPKQKPVPVIRKPEAGRKARRIAPVVVAEEPAAAVVERRVQPLRKKQWSYREGITDTLAARKLCAYLNQTFQELCFTNHYEVHLGKTRFFIRCLDPPVLYQLRMERVGAVYKASLPQNAIDQLLDFEQTAEEIEASRPKTCEDLAGKGDTKERSETKLEEEIRKWYNVPPCYIDKLGFYDMLKVGLPYGVAFSVHTKLDDDGEGYVSTLAHNAYDAFVKIYETK